jgi:SAM-dependent methyltransferase
VTGIDITALAVQRLSATLHADFHVADITDPAFPVRGPFDIVNMWDVIYHIIDRSAFERALVNIKNCLRPGGLFLLTDRFGLPDDQAIAAHVQARSLATYQRVLQPAGFELLSLRPLYRFLNRRIISARVDNSIGAIYFAIDSQIRKIASDNMSLAIWRLSG